MAAINGVTFLDPALVEDFVKRTGTKTFQVWFVRNDGALRVMEARKGVTEGLKHKPQDAMSRGARAANRNRLARIHAQRERAGLISVYDTQAKGYRSFHKDKVVRLVCQRTRLETV
jgi:hypothetical protein